MLLDVVFCSITVSLLLWNCGGVKFKFPPDTGRLLGSVDVCGRWEVETGDSKLSICAEELVEEGFLLVASNICSSVPTRMRFAISKA